MDDDDSAQENCALVELKKVTVDKNVADESRNFGEVKEITIYKDYKNKIRDSFNDPFEALQELVDNGLAKGDNWNAEHVSLRMGRGRILEYEDDGAGMTFSDCREAFQYGHKDKLPEGTKYSKYGQGLKNSLTYLFPNSYVLSKAKNADGEMERTIVVFGDQVEEYTGDCMGTARLLLPPKFTGHKRGELFGAISDTLPDSVDPSSIIEKCNKAYLAIFAEGSLLKDLHQVLKKFDNMPETGVQIFGSVRDDVPLEAHINVDRPFAEGRENKSNDILNTDSGKLLSNVVPLWYMPFAGHDLLPDGYVEAHPKPQQEITVNRVGIDWSKHPWTKALEGGLKPSEAYNVVYEREGGQVALAKVQAMELSKDSAECWNLWEEDACGFLLYYNNRAIWREPKFPEDKRKVQDNFLRKVQFKSQRNDTSGYKLLRKLVGKLGMEHPTEEEYAGLRRGLKHIKYKSAFAGQLLMVRVFHDVISMHESKVSLRESKEVTFLWDKIYQREIERCWDEALAFPADDGANQEESVRDPASRRSNGARTASAPPPVDVPTLSCARAPATNVDESMHVTQEGTSQPTTRTGRVIQKTKVWQPPDTSIRTSRQRATPAKGATTSGSKRKRVSQPADKVAVMKEAKQLAKALEKRMSSVEDFFESVKDHAPSLQKHAQVRNTLDRMNELVKLLSDKF